VYSELVLAPFFCVLILNTFFRNLMKRLACGLVLLLALTQVLFVIFPKTYYWANATYIFSNFFKFSFFADNISRVLLLCIGIVMSVTVVLARGMIKDEEHRFNFMNLLLIILAGLNGVVLVRDVFSLYVFLEIVGVASFILIAFDKDMPALEGAFKYIALSSVASVMILVSIAFLLLLSGGTSFSEINTALKCSSYGPLVMVALGAFICGSFIKSGLMPFHGWLADAYQSAPAPVSVLLAGVVTKTVGVYVLMRIAVSVFGLYQPVQNALMFIGAASIIFAALAALGQNDFKRMLAYSSISQVGYIILGLGCGTTLGISGALFHLFNHTVFKSLLFVNAAAVENQSGTRDMDKLGGLASRMPVTGLTSVLASLSTAGVPPLAGFWSKLIIIIALWLSGNYVYAVIAVLGSVLTLAYFLSLQRNVFFGKLKEGLDKVIEGKLYFTIPAVLLAIITVGVGVAFPYILNTFILPVSNIFGG
jgi:multicomponent Na+:H+ antiporter subunit D